MRAPRQRRPGVRRRGLHHLFDDFRASEDTAPVRREIGTRTLSVGPELPWKTGDTRFGGCVDVTFAMRGRVIADLLDAK